MLESAAPAPGSLDACSSGPVSEGKCSRTNRPITAREDSVGISIDPSMPLPLIAATVIAALLLSSSRESANARSRKISWPACRFTSLMVEALLPLPENATQPVASTTGAAPRTVMPFAGIAGIAPAPNCIAPAMGWFLRNCARIRIKSPSRRFISPCSIGRANCRSSGSASPEGLRKGSGMDRLVPTRSDVTRNCEGGCRLPTALGTRTASFQLLLPVIHGLSQARSSYLSTSAGPAKRPSSVASAASVASPACCPTRKLNTPGWLSNSTRKSCVANPCCENRVWPLTWVKAMSQRESERLARSRSSVPSIRFSPRPSRSGKSSNSATLATPLMVAAFRCSPYSRFNELSIINCRNGSPRVSESISSFSTGAWKSAMPPTTRLMALPRSTPTPAMSMPGPSKATSISIASPAGQLSLNFSVAPRMRACASKRPVLFRNGQSSRSPPMVTRPSSTWPSTSALSSQRTVDSGILLRIQNFFAVAKLAGARSAARSSVGAVPSPWKPSSARTSAPKSLPRNRRRSNPTVQPGPAFQAATVPLSWASTGWRNPPGQSTRTAPGSMRITPPRSSNWIFPARPDTPGCLAKGCSSRCDTVIEPVSGPSRRPRIRTSRSRACGLDCCRNTRTGSGNRSLNETTAASGARSSCGPDSLNWYPSSITSWSRCATLPALAMFRRGAINCQPFAVTRQRALASNLSKSIRAGRLLPSLSRKGWAECMRACWISASSVNSRIRRSCSFAQTPSLAVPCSGTAPTEASARCQWESTSLSAPTQSNPLPVTRCTSSTADSGRSPDSAQAETPTRNRGPFTRIRASTRGTCMSTFSLGARIVSWARSICSSPNPSRRSSGSASVCPGRPTTFQRPSASCTRVSSRSRILSSVSGCPGSSPEYIATCNCARPMASSVAPLPTCRSSRMKRGPRRVHSPCALEKLTGSPTRALSHAAILSGCRSTIGNNWLAMPTISATAISTTNTP